jgi:hypothetical protein
LRVGGSIGPIKVEICLRGLKATDPQARFIEDYLALGQRTEAAL